MSDNSAIHQALMFSQQGGLAKETPWLDGVLEWLTSEADSGAKSSGLLPSAVPDGFLERTLAEFCPSVVAPFAQQSPLFERCTRSDDLELLVNALDALPERDFLNLIAGEISTRCWPTWQNSAMGSPTAFLTLSLSEAVQCIATNEDGVQCPNDAGGSSLSRILEATGDVAPKFFLSPRAASGILRRAAKRGRELPSALHAALTALAGADTPDEGGKTT